MRLSRCIRPALAAPLGVGLALVLAASGAGSPRAAAPVALRATPGPLLASCDENPLLRPICPRQLPAWGSDPPVRPGYYCQARSPHQTVREGLTLFKTKSCLFAEWSYEGGAGLSDWTAGSRLLGWDGRRWVPDEWSMLPPPLHVGVDVKAGSASLLSVPSPKRSARLADALLAPSRAGAVSLGWVRWHGRRGRLVLSPWGACETGDELTFYIPANAEHTSYAITLDAWMPAARLVSRRRARSIRFQRGPALPHVIATLKAIVEATLTPRGTAGSRR